LNKIVLAEHLSLYIGAHVAPSNRNLPRFDVLNIGIVTTQTHWHGWSRIHAIRNGKPLIELFDGSSFL